MRASRIAADESNDLFEMANLSPTLTGLPRSSGSQSEDARGTMSAWARCPPEGVSGTWRSQAAHGWWCVTPTCCLRRGDVRCLMTTFRAVATGLTENRITPGAAMPTTKVQSARAVVPTANASELIDARIEELGDWRGEMPSRLRALIK